MKKQQIILVTGASSGIGKSCAEFLANQGHIVYGTSRNLGKLASSHANFKALELDVESTESVQKAIATILEEQSRLDVLVNNAGYALMGSIEETSDEQVQKAYNTNVFGVQRLLREVLPIMRSQRSGRIISISSIAGRFGLPFRGVYSSSKAALENMMESLQYEVNGFGIHVSLIEPGDVKTSINDHRESTATKNGKSPYNAAFEKASQHIVDTVDNGMDPMEVSKRVHQAITAKNPDFRYVVGTAAQRLSITANHLLPNHLFRKIVRQYMNLD